MRSLVTCLAGPIAEEIAAGREPRNLDPTAALLEEQPPIRYGPDGQCYSSAAQWARHFLKDGDYERAYAAFDELAPLARARAIELVRGQWHMKAASASVRR